MLNLKKLNPAIVDALHYRGHTDDDIKNMTPSEAFDEACSWYGLIGWGPTLRAMYENVQDAGS